MVVSDESSNYTDMGLLVFFSFGISWCLFLLNALALYSACLFEACLGERVLPII
ncbi:hypothetical protein KFK09_027859 [Dendrobium nobile]|uniref:Uncharacterized protein n=1 Tax=Dendrobium nobile TaxID=94219 RepID=A0A8T3A0C0_DENNO|nr:hypothetical protein KFK09_027859 [Dendrobium nobile]